MRHEFTITQKEREYLRELARVYLEYANLPVMEERRKLWYAHNALKGSRPVVVIEHGTFEDEVLLPSKCQSPAAKAIERQLMSAIRNFEIIGDDKVISPYFEVNWKIDVQAYGVEVKFKYAEDTRGKKLGFAMEHPIKDLKEDFHKLKPSVFTVDRKYTAAWKEFAAETLYGILPVVMKNDSLTWHTAPSARIVELMGLEAMMYAMFDYPDELKALYHFICDNMKAFLRWQEKEGLLELNNGNDYVGAGSYGFTDELPSENCKKTGRVLSTDLWGNLNSQETVSISSDMFGEFAYPAYRDLAANFGLVYYGCCEPVHSVWADYISKLPGLRKVSVSPWCDEEFMGEALRGGPVIYSRKPSPNFIGVERKFDEEAFTAHITKTLKAAKGCELEIIYRDIYTTVGDLGKPGKAVKIIRKLIEKMW